MPSNTRDKIVGALTKFPQTPNIIAKLTGYTQKTVQTILLDEANGNKKIRYEKVGRSRLFWIEAEKEGN